jgi:excisionase family DNA binding protein
MENAVNSNQILYKRWKRMLKENDVMTTQEACQYLRISRPTFLKYLYIGKIKGAKAGKGWKVLRSELDRFLKGEISQAA